MERGSEELPVIIGQSGALDGQRWYVRNTIIIGRDAVCDIVVEDRQVSRQHVRIHTADNGVILEDLGSKNGTHHNGARIKDSIQLQDGDVIQIALAQKFIFVSSDATLPLEMGHSTESLILKGRLQLDRRARRVIVAEREITPPLSVAQFTLLEMLYQKDGRVVSRHDLIHGIWKEEEAYEVSNQALDALVRRLRDRIREVDEKHEYIITVRGHGLRLENPLD
ncbi:MAG: FHA domain-containing protein [Anaerolineae bacterium]|nr:FHA domain-containing protein [Anaerolineae bacterium]